MKGKEGFLEFNVIVSHDKYKYHNCHRKGMQRRVTQLNNSEKNYIRTLSSCARKEKKQKKTKN